MYTESLDMLPTHSIQYSMYACMYPQIILLVWGSKQYMQVYLVYSASIAPPTYVNICYIYRLRYVIGCMWYTNSCKFGILQKVCVQLKISELVKLKCQQSSCPQSVSCPNEKWSPPLQRGHTRVSSLHSRLPW